MRMRRRIRGDKEILEMRLREGMKWKRRRRRGEREILEMWRRSSVGGG